MATVKIKIRGIALCYLKNGVWKILLPFNHCHSAKFLVVENNNEILVGHLATRNTSVQFVTHNATPPATTSTQDFDNDVLNLTAHQPLLRRRAGWQQRGILLTLQNTQLGVLDRLHDFQEVRALDVFLTDDAVELPITRMAHALKGEIQLDQNGIVSVEVNGANIFNTNPGESKELIIDNDCMEKNPLGRNDMDMLYQLVEDADPQHPNRQFKVIGRVRPIPPPNVVALSIPPQLLAGKPCLSVKADDSQNLPETLADN